jgi:hypothetical protein
MSEVFDLDSLREEVEREFAPLRLTVGDQEVVLGNPIRMPKEDRKALQSAFNRLDEMTTAVQKDEAAAAKAKEEGVEYTSTIDADEVEADLLVTAQSIIKIAAGKAGTKLVNKIGDDLQLTMKLIELWGQKVSPGEASSSES